MPGRRVDWNPSEVSRYLSSIGHFRVAFCLCQNESSWNHSYENMFEDSFWNRGTMYLRNGLLPLAEFIFSRSLPWKHDLLLILRSKIINRVSSIVENFTSKHTHTHTQKQKLNRPTLSWLQHLHQKASKRKLKFIILHVRFLLYLDIDECANNPCNQWCKNTNGGYICHCHKGYELQGKNTCVGRLLNHDIDICVYASFYLPGQTSLKHLTKCQLVTRYFTESGKSLFNFPSPLSPKAMLEEWIYFGWMSIIIVLGWVGEVGRRERPYIDKRA